MQEPASSFDTIERNFVHLVNRGRFDRQQLDAALRDTLRKAGPLAPLERAVNRMMSEHLKQHDGAAAVSLWRLITSDQMSGFVRDPRLLVLGLRALSENDEFEEAEALFRHARAIYVSQQQLSVEDNEVTTLSTSSSTTDPRFRHINIAAQADAFNAMINGYLLRDRVEAAFDLLEDLGALRLSVTAKTLGPIAAWLAQHDQVPNALNIVDQVRCLVFVLQLIGDQT